MSELSAQPDAERTDLPHAERADLIVIGAGPGGLAAAARAAACGISVVLLDEHRLPGGQIFRRPLALPAPAVPDYARSIQALYRGDAVPDLSYRPDHTVWAISGDNVVYAAGPEGTRRLTAPHIVLATGAYEWPVPMPGWTLPGVMTAGGAQSLLKASGRVAGQRVLVAGAGPLILQAAAQLAEAGAQVVAVLDAAPAAEWWASAARILAHPSLAGEGLSLLARLRAKRVPVKRGWTVVQMLGTEAVAGALVAPVGADGRARRDVGEFIQVDAVCLGFGLIPSVELAALRGCALDFAPALGVWGVRRDPGMATSAAGVYAVGDGAAVHGARRAVIEGRIAGLAVAQSLGRTGGRDAAREMAALHKGLARLRPLDRYLASAFRPRTGLLDLAEDGVVVCRCEDVTARTVRNEIGNGARTLHEVKTSCRAGMGNCQGRNCMPTIARMLAAATGESPGTFGYPKPRPPVRPCGATGLSLAPASPSGNTR